MRSPLVTRHAIDRAVQRLGVGRRFARSTLNEAFRRSIVLPERYARSLAGKPRLRRRRKESARYRVAGSTLMVCHGRTVVTVWKLDTQQLATVIWWAATGIWEA